MVPALKALANPLGISLFQAGVLGAVRVGSAASAEVCRHNRRRAPSSRRISTTNGCCTKLIVPSGRRVSGHTPPGEKLYIQVRKSTIATEQVIVFLRHLLRHIRLWPIMIFWDGGRPHKSDPTRAFVGAHPRLETHRFPGCTLALNPGEWEWRHLKIHELASYAPHDVKELGRELRRAVARIRVRPKLIRSFVADTHPYDQGTDGH